MGAHVGHDGGHFAVSRIPWINDIAVWGMSGLANPIYWQHQHTYGHHSFTNDEHNDPDLHHFKGLFKVYKNEVDPTKQVFDDPKLRTSTWFVLGVYSQVSLALGIWFPSRFVIDRSIHGTVEWTDRKRLGRTLLFYMHLVIYTTLVLFVPMIVQPTTFWGFVTIFTHVIVSSFYFSIATQVGHISDTAVERDYLQKVRSERHPSLKNVKSWAAEQIECSQDVGPLELVWYLFFGGLGLQIEHHLFPNLNHCHLMKIQPIVEQTCHEYGVHYTKYTNWFAALRDTIQHIKNCEL
jgi:fatty acid desaturase